MNVIKGVQPDAMETAREAARRSGLSLGQWINSAIIETAAESGMRPGGARSSHDEDSRIDDDGFVAINQRLDHLARRLDRMMTRAAVPPPRRDEAAEACPHVAPSLRAMEERLTSIAHDLAPESRATSQRLADAITRLNAKLDPMVAAGPHAAGQERRVAAVDRALAALNREPAKAAPTAAGWPSAVEVAIAEIAARQRVLDAVDMPAARVAEAGRARMAERQSSAAPNLAGLEAQLRQITTQLETLRAPCRAEEQVAGLRGDLADIGRKLTDALPRRILEGLQAEIRGLPGRHDAAAENSHSPELANVEQGLANIRDALHSLAPAESVAGFDDEVRSLSAKIDVLAARGLDPELLDHLEQAIAELRGIASNVASGDAIAALANDVRLIGQKLDRVVGASRDGGRDMEALARRVDALAAALEARSADHGEGVPANFDLLINTLADRLETTRPSGPEPAAFDRLQEQIVRLAQKLDVSDGRLGQLGAVERTMTDLMAELRDARDNAIEAAQVAARATARDMLDQSAESFGDVDAIKQDIAELRHTQLAIDRRTQDTLEAVHNTLERMVDRLAMIETDLQDGQTRPSRATHAIAPRAEIGAFAPAQPAPARQARPARSPAREPDLPADHPLEPGSGAPSGRVPTTAAERIAASEAALETIKPPTPPESGGKANFIAAARRAAQAAAADPSAGAASAGENRSSTLGVIRNKLARSRRPLVLGIAAFLLVIGTLHIVTNMLGSGERPAVEPPRASPNDPAVPPHESANPPQNRSAGDAVHAPVMPPALAVPLHPPVPAPDKRSDLSPSPAAPASITAGAAIGPAAFTTASPFMIGPIGDVTGSTARPQGIAAPPPGPRAAAIAAGSVAVPAGADKLPAAIGPADLRAAAAAGNAAAAYEIGIRYAEGRGVAQNFEEAIRWLDAAAQGGLAPAQYRLGSLYEKGQGTRKDREAARKLYAAAAEKGNGKAMHNLAVLYAEGLEGKPDYQMASQLFHRAADRGVSDSQYNLGILYARGIGVEQNLAESYKWFALAADQGDADAGKKRDEVAARLDPQSLVAARLAVQTWTADPQPEEAISVKAPAGGWDHAAAAAKPKAAAPAPRRSGSSS
ncbi:MAG: hypothetical protein ABSG76_03620 [Xanthobacteraceae bacterium]